MAVHRDDCTIKERRVSEQRSSIFRGHLVSQGATLVDFDWDTYTDSKISGADIITGRTVGTELL